MADGDIYVMLESVEPKDVHLLFDSNNMGAMARLKVTDRVEYERIIGVWRGKKMPRLRDFERGVADRLRKADERAKHAEREALADSGESIISHETPLDTAEQFREAKRPTLAYYNGDWLFHRVNQYVEVSEKALRSGIYRYTAACIDIDSGERFHPNRSTVDYVLDALNAVAHVEVGEFEPPCWIDDAMLIDMPPAREIIACRNGLLHLPTQTLYPNTPAFFTRNGLAFDYDPLAPEPVQWLEFLSGLWPASPESIACLQEMFGYLLVPDTSQQKIFILIGPPRAGKGTIGRVLVGLLGKENTVATTLPRMSQTFGLASMIGKQLAIISDMRTSSKTDIGQVAENLLRISGEDFVTIERKYKVDWHGKLDARFVLMANMPPIIPDLSGALVSRLVPLAIRESFLGREDTTLTDRLLTELPGILNWAIEGWKRLQARGHFVLTAEGREVAHDMSLYSSPLSAFLREACVLDPTERIKTVDLYEAYEEWAAHLDGIEAMSITESEFGRQLVIAGAGRIGRKRPRTGDGGKQESHYTGVRLRVESDPEVDA